MIETTHLKTIPVKRTYNHVAPLLDFIAERLRAKPGMWLVVPLTDIPGGTRKNKQIRLHEATRRRGIRATTRTDSQNMYILPIAEVS